MTLKRRIKRYREYVLQHITPWRKARRFDDEDLDPILSMATIELMAYPQERTSTPTFTAPSDRILKLPREIRLNIWKQHFSGSHIYLASGEETFRSQLIDLPEYKRDFYLDSMTIDYIPHPPLVSQPSGFQAFPEILNPFLVCRAWHKDMVREARIFEEMILCATRVRYFFDTLPRLTSCVLLQRVQTMHISGLVTLQDSPWLETKALAFGLSHGALPRLKHLILDERLFVTTRNRVKTFLHTHSMPVATPPQISQSRAMWPATPAPWPRPQQTFEVASISFLVPIGSTQWLCSHRVQKLSDSPLSKAKAQLFRIAHDRGIVVELRVGSVCATINKNCRNGGCASTPPSAGFSTPALMVEERSYEEMESRFLGLRGGMSTEDWTIRLREEEGDGDEIVVQQERPPWFH